MAAPKFLVERTGRAAENDELRAGVNRFVEEREGGAAGTLHP
jgi:hypothetical protein